MSRLGFLVFFLIALSLFGGIHYYFWVRLVRDTALPAPWRQWVTAALVFLLLSVPANMILWRTARARWLIWPGYVWMGMTLMLLVSLIGADVVRLVAHLGGGVADPERRLWLRRVLGGAAATMAAALGAYALREALGRVALREVAVTLPTLPRPLDGFTIVQLTDVHVGPTIGRGFIEELVARTNALEPDVVAITGDLVDASVDELRAAVAPLARLRARHGVYFVTGNHEYYVETDEWLEHLRGLGLRVLRNERVRLVPERGGLDLAGVDDFSARRHGHGPDLARALAGSDAATPVVLLAHQPRAIAEAAAHGVALQLSGHTHGGQIWPWSYLVRLQQPYVAGLFRHGDTQLYVSRGTGYWGPPMRLHAPAELTRITLRAPV